MTKVKRITEITVTDPDSHLEVQVTIYKMENGGMVGIDSSFIANTDDPVYSPYDKKRVELDIEASETAESGSSYEFKLYSSKELFENRKWYDEVSGFDNFISAKYAAIGKALVGDIIKVQSEDREHIEIMNENGKPIVNI